MKRNFKLILKIVSVVLIIVSISLIIFTHDVSFNYDLCVYLFGCTPQEFLDYEFEYDELNDLRKTARVNKKGELVLFFSRQREKSLLESEWLKSVYDDFSEYNIVVDPDLKTITLYTSDAKGDEYLDEQIRALNKIVCKIHFTNFLNNNTTESITIVEKRLEEHEEIYRFDLPYGEAVGRYVE